MQGPVFEKIAEDFDGKVTVSTHGAFFGYKTRFREWVL